MEEASAADDRSISDDDDLWRRINPNWIVPDGNRNELRISSQAFQNLQGDKLSVLLASKVRETGRTPHDVLHSFPGFALASVPVGVARELGQAIVRAPEDEEPAHCHMVGTKTKSTKKALSKAAQWVVEPTASSE